MAYKSSDMRFPRIMTYKKHGVRFDEHWQARHMENKFIALVYDYNAMPKYTTTQFEYSVDNKRFTSGAIEKLQLTTTLSTIDVEDATREEIKEFVQAFKQKNALMLIINTIGIKNL